MTNIIRNPFIGCTARDMSYSEVVEFWCPPYECYRINVGDLQTSKTPIIIEGARGSGKTMILKHHSYFCAKEDFDKECLKLDALEESGYLGVYFRYSADYSSLFDTLSCSNTCKYRLFDRYFQLSLSAELCKIVMDFQDEFDEAAHVDIFCSLKEQLNVPCSSFEELLDWIKKEILAQDTLIKRAQYDPITEAMCPSTNDILFQIVDVLHSSIEKLKNVLFLLIIDEYENVGVYQSIINTYLKQTDGDRLISFRIGMRPGGMTDYKTNVSEEILQEDRDFIRKKLVVDTSDRSSRFPKFVQSVVDRRLNMVPLFRESKVGIVDLLGKKENYEDEAKQVVNGRKKHFDDIKSPQNGEDLSYVIASLSNESTLIEAYHIMRYQRGDTIEEILSAQQEHLDGISSSRAKKYELDLNSKYKAALLFWLINKYKVKKMYYSFATYLYLSSGSIYDFIGLCRNLFDELESDYFNRFKSNPVIPMHLQTKAAQKYAKAQMEKIKFNHEYGRQMWFFVQNMCSVFSYYHKGDLCIKYPETNQFYLSGDMDNPGTINGDIWASLIKWGIVIAKPSLQRATLTSKRITQLYYINKIYYPIFNISCRFRGGFNFKVTDEIWDQMIRPAIAEPESYITRKKSKDKASEPSITSNPSVEEAATNIQLSMFDDLDRIQAKQKT